MGKTERGTDETVAASAEPSIPLSMVRELIEQSNRSAIDGALAAQRGVLGIRDSVATAEERWSAEIGRPIPDRRPFSQYLLPLSLPEPYSCSAFALVTRKSMGDEVTDLWITPPPEFRRFAGKYPADLFTRCHLPEQSKRDPNRIRQRLDSDHEDQYSIPFLQWLSDTYSKSLKAAYASGHDPALLRGFVSGEPIEIDPGEVKRVA
jgi:hypothetical protein